MQGVELTALRSSPGACCRMCKSGLALPHQEPGSTAAGHGRHGTYSTKKDLSCGVINQPADPSPVAL